MTYTKKQHYVPQVYMRQWGENPHKEFLHAKFKYIKIANVKNENYGINFYSYQGLNVSEKDREKAANKTEKNFYQYEKAITMILNMF